MAMIEHREWRRAPATFRQRFIVGVDLGQSTDPTAIAVLHWRCRPLETWTHDNFLHRQDVQEHIDVRHLERLPLGMAYPAVVQHVANLLIRPPLCGDDDFPAAELVIDETGVGRAVGDIFEAAGMRPKRVTITAGTEATSGHGLNRYHVAKTILISQLDAALHIGRLRFASALADAAAMAEELKDFRRKVSDAGRSSYAARTGSHDDLVLSVAIANWWFNEPPPPVPTFAYY
jgi:hypothetical protein